MSEELKTIKELADELGVSKQAIQYHIKSLTNKNRQTDKRKEPNINQYLLNEIEEIKKNRDKQ